ncbi:MAG: phosphatase family protein [Sphingomonadales bacterium]|nr:phosphatase family protein [Sphingomonadales bacterium]
MKSGYLAAVATVALLCGGGTASADPKDRLHYLTIADVDPGLILPKPFASGSEGEKAELVELHRVVASASPARLAQAKWDDENEDPAIFDGVLGIKLEAMPATWALLKEVQEEGEAAADVSKTYFNRARPWSTDPTLPNCDAGKKANPRRSYPSGHSTLSYSVGYVLAHLAPEKADIILSRAADYAMSREICGVHYPSDTEASHVLATIIGVKLVGSPVFVAKMAAARGELRTAHLTN